MRREVRHEISDLKKLYSLRGDANALGGFLEAPVAKVLPTLAPVSLPRWADLQGAVGGVYCG